MMVKFLLGKIYSMAVIFSLSKITVSLHLGSLKKNLHLKHNAKKKFIFLKILKLKSLYNKCNKLMWIFLDDTYPSF